MISHIKTICRLALLNRWVTFLTGSIVILLVVGCATDRIAWRNRLNPWAAETSTPTGGAATVEERIEHVRQLQQDARTMTQAERTATTRTLSNTLASDTEPAVKAQVIEALGYFDTAEAIEGLRDALQDSNPDVRITACRSLGRIRTRSAMQLLIEAQRSDTNIDVRQNAIRELGKFHDPAAVAALGESLSDADPAVQLLAMRSLQQATGEKLGDDVRRWKEHVASLPLSDPGLR